MSINYRVQIPAAIILLVIVSSLPAGAQTELIVNGGFESGGTGWTMSGGAGYSSGYGHSGNNFLYLGGAIYENDAAYQTIAIPSTAVSATLSFYYNITTVRLKTRVNRADCDCHAYLLAVFVEKESVKWAFSRKAIGSESVEWCKGWPRGRAAF